MAPYLRGLGLYKSNKYSWRSPMQDRENKKSLTWLQRLRALSQVFHSFKGSIGLHRTAISSELHVPMVWSLIALRKLKG